jgi:hypothetical protein
MNNQIKITLFLFLLVFISSTDYHGYLQDINGEYLTGDFTFDESKLPLDLTPYQSNQLRHPESVEDYLIKKNKYQFKSRI